ncbi:MAG TPA: thiol peroxidase [Bdellovibrionota bacterium]|jgi:thiol peroxidase|nr:thiol peroxidase [Bdellovibrionota bacterium]
MAKITFQGKPAHTSGTLPAVGTQAPDFKLVCTDLTEATLADYRGKKKILNVFPSVDTGTCAASVRLFNQHAAKVPDIVVLNISKDLPFAQKRFCGAEGIDNVEVLSAFRSDFAQNYGVEILDTVLAGLCARAVIVLDGDDRVIYTEQVHELVQEPNYEAALRAAR